MFLPIGERDAIASPPDTYRVDGPRADGRWSTDDGGGRVATAGGSGRQWGEEGSDDTAATLPPSGGRPSHGGEMTGPDRVWACVGSRQDTILCLASRCVLLREKLGPLHNLYAVVDVSQGWKRHHLRDGHIGRTPVRGGWRPVRARPPLTLGKTAKRGVSGFRTGFDPASAASILPNGELKAASVASHMDMGRHRPAGRAAW